jgi:hypothetical protein
MVRVRRCLHGGAASVSNRGHLQAMNTLLLMLSAFVVLGLLRDRMRGSAYLVMGLLIFGYVFYVYGHG